MIRYPVILSEAKDLYLSFANSIKTEYLRIASFHLSAFLDEPFFVLHDRLFPHLANI